MPSFDFTTREANVLILALNSPVGVPPSDRSLAESLRLRIKHQLCQRTTPPTTTTYLRSAWPGNHTLPTKTESQWYKPQEKVRLAKPTKPAKPMITVDDVLKGLI